MKSKDFFNSVANGKVDLLEYLLKLLKQTGTDYCAIGGLAVNAYVEPVISLDLDIIVVAANIEKLCKKALEAGLKVEQFPHSINLSSPDSDLRIQIQTDIRYQDFIKRAESKVLLDYKVKVAAIEDVLLGKIWAHSDAERRKSKRQKDLADIIRIIESYPHLASKLPDEIKELIK